MIPTGGFFLFKKAGYLPKPGTKDVVDYALAG